MSRVTLTGITTTGIPHLGNYVGAVRPAIAASNASSDACFFFLADYHALIKASDPEVIQASRTEIAATWLACGLDPEKVVFYRQSDIPEIPQLTWLLTCVCAKGLMNRAHAYKAAVQDNLDAGNDEDKAITMGLFSYPILMAADILMFRGTHVPVGRDQIQHIEMAADLAQRFNHIYGEGLLTVPEAVVDDNVPLLTGLDGRKMSKSYGNTIPLFDTEKKLRKAVNKIVTNSLEPGEPKDPDSSTLFEIYSAFANADEIASIRQAYADGIAWGEMKGVLFEKINAELAEPREKYAEIMANPSVIEDALQHGAERARAISKPYIEELRNAVGIA